MKKTKLLLLTTLGLALSLTGCSQETTEPPPAVTDPYEACCGAEPVEHTFGDAYMFVPNVFTPNGDGINDYFAPSINENILGFDAYLIYTPVGDTVVFVSAGYNVNNVANTAWDGLRKDGSVYEGLFKYVFTAFAKDGNLLTIEGRACRVACGPEAAVFKTKTGCFYPVQAGANGVLDTAAPNFEGDCFK